MPFDGNRKKVENFIQECRAYLQINRRIYTTDESKVAFFMSLMKEKEALKWKQTYIRSITDEEGEIIYPPVKDFVQLLLNYFQPINQERDAVHQLSQLKQGKKTAEEVITQFRLLTAQAGYTAESKSDHMHLIEKLQKVLNTSLVMKIMLLENAPTTIDGWVEKAILIDGQYRATMEMIGKNLGNKKERPGKPRWSNYFDKKKKRDNDDDDDDAMDIDRLSPEKRTALMKKGACFICEEPGHMAKEHDEYERKKKKTIRRTDATPSKSPSKSPSKKKDIKEIHALLQTLSPDKTRELLVLQASGQEQEEKEEEKEDDDSDF
jgi:hypothetical protein